MLEKNYIARGTAADNKIRMYAVTGRDVVQSAKDAHSTTAVATAALGRLLLGGAMMGIMMKGDRDVLTITMKGDGPLGAIVVTADSHGNVKGYVNNPDVVIPLNYADKLDVGAAIGYGEMTVVKDLGLKEPYVSQLPLGTSEVAEDLTFYFYKSEQTPTSVALGVLVDGNENVKQAGGFILQLMPDADDELAGMLEDRLKDVKPVTAMLEDGMMPEDIIKTVLKDLNPVINDTVPVRFKCGCSKEHFAKALVTLGKTELEKMIEDKEPVNIRCHFCNRDYTYSIEELKQLNM